MSIIELLNHQFGGCKVKITNPRGEKIGTVEYFDSYWSEYPDVVVCVFEDGTEFFVDPDDNIEIV